MLVSLSRLTEMTEINIVDFLHIEKHNSNLVEQGQVLRIAAGKGNHEPESPVLGWVWSKSEAVIKVLKGRM